MRKETIALLFVISALIVAYFVLPGLGGEMKKDKEKITAQPSIAILPFVNMSNDPNQEYFSDELTDGILNSVTRLKGLKVCARTSSFEFKGKDVDLREVGKKLDVRTILEGSVQRHKDKVRITVQLINVEDGFHFWWEQYD